MVIQYGKTEYQQLGGILPPASIRTFQGVNTYDPFMIDDSYFTDSSNVVSDDYPALTVRPGYTVLGTFGTAVLGLSFWKSEIHAVFNDGTWRKLVGGTWTTLTTGLSTSAKWSFTVFQGNFDEINLVGTNGVNAKKYDGSTIVDLTGAPAGINYITTYQNRLWGAVGKELHSCALDQPEQWELFEGTEEDSFAKDTESMRGESIIMLSGSLTKLTIGMKNALFEMYGELPSNFTVKLIVDDVGIMNNQSWTTQRGLMRIIDEQGIYDYGGGTIPDKDFSDIVGGYLTGITDSCAGADVDKLYFKTNTNTTMVFDSRSGVNAWSVWKDFNPLVFATLDNHVYVGDSQGRVLQLGGTTDGGTAISWYAITKLFTNASMAQKMRWYKMFIFAELAAGSTFNVSFSKSASGDSDWELMQSITGTGGIKIQRIIIPVAKYARENYIRIKFHGTGWMRLHEHTRQQRQLPLY